MPKRITYKERAQVRGWNTRFQLDREMSRRWLARHRGGRWFPRHERPWWWWLAAR